jgi:hypothetical protein
MIALPKGQLLDDGEGALTAQVRASRPARREMRAWYERLADSRPRGVVAHTRLDDGQRGFEIHFEPQPRDALPFDVAIGGWRDDPPTAVPAVIELACFVLGVSSELAARGFGDALVSPATLRLIPGTPGIWRLVPLPTRCMSLADWARAEPGNWLWSTPDEVLTGAGLDPVHRLGAVLHQAMAGQPFPEILPNRERFSRLLRGRIGVPLRLAEGIRKALPRSLEEDAAALERLILDCLEPSTATRPDPASVRERLASMTEKLATERLIRYWGFENQPTVVARLRGGEPLPAPAEGAPPPATTPALPWDEQVPRLIERGDFAGALEAAWNDIHETGPSRIRFYLAVVQRIAARRPGPSTEVSAAIDRLLGAFGDRLDESDILRLAHIRTRHLGEKTDRFGVAHRKFESRWNDATARLMQARMLLTTGQAYNQVSRLCKEARGLYESMPEKGGKAALYATAYLNLLDGIANVGAVSVYRNASFYNDAFDAFGRSLELATRVGDDPMIRACLRWFGWLGRFTRPAGGATSSILSAGIEAVLRSHGLTIDAMAAAGIPEIPWYDEAWLFPV